MKIKNLIQDKLLLANFISNLFYTMAYPSVHYTVIKNIDQRLISLNMILICLSGILIPILWGKYHDKFYCKFRIFCNIETILYISLYFAIINNVFNYKWYYIFDTLFYCCVSRNIMCGAIRLRAIIYKDPKKREIYDNNIQIVSNISSLLGYAISIIDIPVYLAFLLITIGMIADNFIYSTVWKNNI